jgi:hypothetical protein
MFDRRGGRGTRGGGTVKIGMDKVLEVLQTLERAGWERLGHGVAGILVLCVGLGASGVLQRVARNWGEEFGVERPAVLGRRVFLVCAAASGILALKHAGLETGLLEGAFHIVLGAAALAGALAAGLGARELVRNLVSGLYLRDIYEEGLLLEIDGTEASLESVGAVTARLRETDGTGCLIVPNAELLGRVVTCRSRPAQDGEPHGRP